MEFEWHEEKRQSNLEKHGVDFRDAIRVFQDEKRLWGFDDRHSDFEDRWWTVGMTHDTVLTVVWTERGGVIRLISARRATRDEQTAYYESLAR